MLRVGDAASADRAGNMKGEPRRDADRFADRRSVAVLARCVHSRAACGTKKRSGSYDPSLSSPWRGTVTLHRGWIIRMTDDGPLARAAIDRARAHTARTVDTRLTLKLVRSLSRYRRALRDRRPSACRPSLRLSARLRDCCWTDARDGRAEESRQGERGLRGVAALVGTRLRRRFVR